MKNITLLLMLFISAISNAQFPYEMPKLDYNYDAFEPIIDSQTMRIHYNNHHKGYVTNLNKALENANFKNESLESLFLKMDSLRKVFVCALEIYFFPGFFLQNFISILRR
jgi:superoxide dismutase